MDRPMIRRRGLMGCLSLAVFACAAASASPADAQQVLAGKGAVTIDLGVLNQLGQPVTGGYAPQGGSYPAYGQPAYGQAAYGQPYALPYTQGYQTYGGLQFPPQQYPVSSLMVQPPAGSTPYVPQAASTSAPAMTPAAATTAPAATTSMAGSSASTTAGTPPPAPTPTPTTVPMLPATTDTSSAATNTASATTTTTDTSSPAATTTATTTTGTETTGGTAATGTEANTASTGATSVVPAATPLATETTGAASTGATTAATGAADTGTAATGTTATGTTGTESTSAAAPAASGTTTGTAATGATTSGTQTASVAPGTATAASTEGEVRIAFPADSADIPDATRGQLDELAQKMAGDENIRIQILAYASGTSDQASRARRMSLSRALAVRSYLIKAGVRSTRMDVRALGNNVEGSPADRVDIIPKAQ